MEIKTFTIGDTHGKSIWKCLADISCLLKDKNRKPEYDKYIFIGDYVDDWDTPDEIILQNLKDIIQFKKDFPNNVVLLYGNHCLQYALPSEIFFKHICSGYRPQMRADLHKLFSDNADLFMFSYQIGNTLWSHAGISSGWIKEQNIKINDVAKISDILNTMFKIYDEKLFVVGRSRGGLNKFGGPIWADQTETLKDCYTTINQIIGHSSVKNIEIFHKDDKTLVYVDCLSCVHKGYSKTVTI